MVECGKYVIVLLKFTVIIESARNSQMQNYARIFESSGALFSIELLRRCTKPASTVRSFSFLHRSSHRSSRLLLQSKTHTILVAHLSQLLRETGTGFAIEEGSTSRPTTRQIATLAVSTTSHSTHRPGEV